MDYYNKYLKYKNKYISLKNQLGGYNQLGGSSVSESFIALHVKTPSGADVLKCPSCGAISGTSLIITHNFSCPNRINQMIIPNTISKTAENTTKLPFQIQGDYDREYIQDEFAREEYRINDENIERKIEESARADNERIKRRDAQVASNVNKKYY
jgi:hypothetical protein